jgi:hypothetical protein
VAGRRLARHWPSIGLRLAVRLANFGHGIRPNGYFFERRSNRTLRSAEFDQPQRCVAQKQTPARMSPAGVHDCVVPAVVCFSAFRLHIAPGAICLSPPWWMRIQLPIRPHWLFRAYLSSAVCVKGRKMSGGATPLPGTLRAGRCDFSAFTRMHLVLRDDVATGLHMRRELSRWSDLFGAPLQDATPRTAVRRLELR